MHYLKIQKEWLKFEKRFMGSDPELTSKLKISGGQFP